MPPVEQHDRLADRGDADQPGQEQDQREVVALVEIGRRHGGDHEHRRATPATGASVASDLRGPRSAAAGRGGCGAHAACLPGAEAPDRARRRGRRRGAAPSIETHSSAACARRSSPGPSAGSVGGLRSANKVASVVPGNTRRRGHAAEHRRAGALQPSRERMLRLDERRGQPVVGRRVERELERCAGPLGDGAQRALERAPPPRRAPCPAAAGPRCRPPCGPAARRSRRRRDRRARCSRSRASPSGRARWAAPAGASSSATATTARAASTPALRHAELVGEARVALVARVRRAACARCRG